MWSKRYCDCLRDHRSSFCDTVTLKDWPLEIILDDDHVTFVHRVCADCSVCRRLRHGQADLLVRKSRNSLCSPLACTSNRASSSPKFILLSLLIRKLWLPRSLVPQTIKAVIGRGLASPGKWTALTSRPTPRSTCACCINTACCAGTASRNPPLDGRYSVGYTALR